MTSDIAITLTQLGAVKRVTATRSGGDAGRRYKGRSGRAPRLALDLTGMEERFRRTKRLGAANGARTENIPRSRTEAASGRPGKSLRRAPAAGRVGTRDTHALPTFSRPGVRNRA